MIGYALVLIAVSLVFKNTIYIDDSYYGIWGLITVIIIFVLNKTIKPVIVWLTLPLIALTMWLFYLIINVFILKITDFILMSHFDIKGIVMSFVVSIVISIMNVMMDKVITNNIIKVKNKWILY